MNCFFKVFVAGIFTQYVLLFLTFSTGIGDGIDYLLYAIPFILLFPLDKVEKKEISIFLMALLPIIIYSIIIAFGFCTVRKLNKNSI